MINLMVKVNSSKQMAVFIRVNGRMNSKMDMVLKSGVMEADIKVISLKTRRTVLEYINSLMARSMQVTGKTIQWMGKESASGQMEKSTVDNGKIT